MKNVLLVGFGSIGNKHAQAIQEVEGLNLTSIVDPYQKNTYKPAENYSTLEAFFNSESKADIASICTPNSMHAEQAIACMEYGMDVLIEKPMAIDKRDAERVIATSLKTNRQVFCVMQLRYSPIVVWLKDILSQGQLGDIFSVEVRCFWNRNENYYQAEKNEYQWRGSLDGDKGPLYTQFSHFVDLIYYLFGDWMVEHAAFNNFNHQSFTEFEDSGRIIFNVDEISGLFSYTTSVFEKNYESTITLIGSKGTIAIGGQYFNQIRYTHPDSLKKLDQSVIDKYSSDRLAGHKAIYENVINVLDAKHPITTNALDGLKVVEMIEDVYARR